MVAWGAGAAGPVLLACRQWDPLGLARRLPSLGVGAWRCAPLLPWRVQCPVCVCAALAAGSGGSGRYLVLCLSLFPLPAPRVPRCVWRAVPSGCSLPSLAGTPFHVVCAFRALGPVALLVVPACPFRVCALALSRCPPPPPLRGVPCAPRVVPALGAGRAVPRGPCPSACPVPVPCSVWRAWGGRSGPGSPLPGLGLWGWRQGVPGGVPSTVARGGPVGRGVALPHSVPLPSLGRQQSGCHWRCAVHGGRCPPYHSGSCSPGFSGYDLCGVLARRRGLACSSRPPWGPAAGAGGRVALRLLSRAGGDHPPCLGGWGPGPQRPPGRWGGGGGGVSRRGLPAPFLGGGLRYSILAPFVPPTRPIPACACGRGRSAAPGWGGVRGGPRTAPPGALADLNPPLPSLSGLWSREGHVGRGLHTVPLCALPRHARMGSREQVQPPLPPPRRPPRLRGGGGPRSRLPSWGGCWGGGGVWGALWSPGDAS